MNRAFREILPVLGQSTTALMYAVGHISASFPICFRIPRTSSASSLITNLTWIFLADRILCAINNVKIIKCVGPIVVDFRINSVFPE